VTEILFSAIQESAEKQKQKMVTKSGMVSVSLNSCMEYFLQKSVFVDGNIHICICLKIYV